MNFQVLAGLLTVAAKLPGFLLNIGQDVASAMADGSVTPDEAEAFARKSSAEHGDLLKVKIKGKDVIDEDAQHDLAAFVGRTVRNIVNALGG